MKIQFANKFYIAALAAFLFGGLPTEGQQIRNEGGNLLTESLETSKANAPTPPSSLRAASQLDRSEPLLAGQFARRDRVLDRASGSRPVLLGVPGNPQFELHDRHDRGPRARHHLRLPGPRRERHDPLVSVQQGDG